METIAAKTDLITAVCGEHPSLQGDGNSLALSSL